MNPLAYGGYYWICNFTFGTRIYGEIMRGVARNIAIRHPENRPISLPRNLTSEKSSIARTSTHYLG